MRIVNYQFCIYIMEYLQNGFTLELAAGSFPLSTDSIALAHFVKLPKNAKVLDLCAGCGTLGIMLCAKDQSCAVTGVEINQTDHAAAVENIRRNGLEGRLDSICADIASFTGSNFNVVVSNPPYYSGGPKSATAANARHDQLCPPELLFKVAARALKFGGDFYLVHKPEMLAHLCGLGQANGMEAKELMLLRHKENGPVSLILLKFRKGAKPGLVITENELHDRSGEPTPYYKSIYHLGA